MERRSTSQREQVLEAVRTGDHPSARDVFDAVSRTTRMSFGTVYRNLGILEEAGEIVAIQTGPEAVRYDARPTRHHHLFCRKCGRVFDVPLPYQEAIDHAAAERSGFLIESHTIAFQGLCRACRGNSGS